MMIEFVFYLYLITVMSYFKTFVLLMSIFLVVIWLIIHFIYVVSHDSYHQEKIIGTISPYIFLRPKKWIALFLSLQLLFIAIPTKEIGYIFLGLKFTETLYKSNQADLDEVTKLALDNLKHVLKNNLDQDSRK